MQNKTLYLAHSIFFISLSVLLGIMTLNLMTLVRQVDSIETDLIETKEELTKLQLQLQEWEIIDEN